MITDQDWPALLQGFQCRTGVNAQELHDLEIAIGRAFPHEYSAFLRYSNGGSGLIAGRAHIILWAMEELVPFNEGFGVGKYAPGLFLFGSDGGGEAFAFDGRSAEEKIVAVPFIGMSPQSVEPVAADFISFLRDLPDCRLYK